MLSRQELLSYVRATYQEYRENDNYDDTFDNFIERRCNGAGQDDKRQFNRIHANSL